MAGKYLTAEEAAAMLGISADKLNELRQSQKIPAMRDAGAWKFRPEDVERYKEEMSENTIAYGGEPTDDEHVESILLSEAELGGPTGSTSSTVIGKHPAPSSESDIKLAQGESDILIGTPSDLKLGSESDVKPGSGLSAKFDDLDSLDLDLGGGSGLSLDSNIKSGSSKKPSSGLSLDDQDLSLGEEPTKPGSSKRIGGSGLNLGVEDDDMVLGGSSGPGSDITLDAGSSGISLVDPKDSGLNLLDVPASLSGSSKKVPSLDMGGQDDEMILLEEDAGDNEAATQLKADDDFLLSPLDEGTEDSDSGSQVIALDSDIEFDEGQATMLGGPQMQAAAAMLEEDLGASEFGEDMGAGGSMGMVSAGGMTADAAVMAAPQVVEAPYSLWNVLSLSVCMVILALTGMMSYDLMRNMWSWDGPYRVNSQMMDTVMKWFE